MKALITGASSGIGREFAYILSDMGYDLVLTARRCERLEEIQSHIKTKAEIICGDLSDEEFCFELADKSGDIDILINNAGFGVFGAFKDSELNKEIEMINVNIKALHILTKLFLKKFTAVNHGYILNVASSASFLPGPLFSSYYASKSYVARLSSAIYEELRRDGSKVKICYMCPGPVDTEFNEVAGVNFALGSVTAKYAAEKGIDAVLKGRRCVTISFPIKCTKFFCKLCPEVISQKFAYKIQKAKI